MINPDDDLEVKEDPTEEESIYINQMANRLEGSGCDPVYGRLSFALIVAELFLQTWPDVYARVFEPSNYEELIIAAKMSMAFTSFTYPLFIAALVIAIISLMKNEKKVCAFITLALVLIVIVLYFSNLLK